VYSRENDGKKFEFGVSGYTLDQTFLLFDRETDSVWYPGANGELNAVGGTRKGDTIPVAIKNEVMPLSDWLQKHPDSKILMPPPHSKTIKDLR